MIPLLMMEKNITLTPETHYRKAITFGDVPYDFQQVEILMNEKEEYTLDVL